KTRHELAPPSLHRPFRTCLAAELTHTWRVKVGVSVAYSAILTPTRNAIGLSSPVGVQSADGVGELSPWRSNLPPRHAEGMPSAQGEAPLAVSAVVGGAGADV